MDFWGVQVPAGVALKVSPEEGSVIHLSQASLTGSNSRARCVTLYVKRGTNTDEDKKIAIALLSHKYVPHASFDLIFKTEFELSHDWKGGSVHFSGYAAVLPIKDAKPDGKAAEPVKESDREDSNGKDNEDYGANESEEDPHDRESEDHDDSDNKDYDDANTEHAYEAKVSNEARKNAEKKRAAERTTTSLAKKAKAATSEQTECMPCYADGKKSRQVATPHTAKQVEKVGAQAHKSGGRIQCSFCFKRFKGDKALQDHTKDKHPGK